MRVDDAHFHRFNFSSLSFLLEPYFLDTVTPSPTPHVLSTSLCAQIIIIISEDWRRIYITQVGRETNLYKGLGNALARVLKDSH